MFRFTNPTSSPVKLDVLVLDFNAGVPKVIDSETIAPGGTFDFHDDHYECRFDYDGIPWFRAEDSLTRTEVTPTIDAAAFANFHGIEAPDGLSHMPPRRAA